MILNELNTMLDALHIPVMTGFFSATEPAPDVYCVLTPIGSEFDLDADDWPQYDVQEVRMTIFTKSNYIRLIRRITQKLLEINFYITDRTFVGYDREFGYNQYAIDVQKEYFFSDTESEE